MIIKLRNRLISTIMAFISLIMLVAFISIYMVTDIRIKNENMEKVNSEETIKASFDGQMVFDGQVIQDAFVISRISPALGVYFNLIADASGDLVWVDSALDLTTDDYQSAALIAMKNPDGGIAELGSRKWQYVTGRKTHLDFDGIMESDGLAVIRFLDITDSCNTLKILLFTLIGLYFVLMIIFFILARHVANRSIQPMAEAWEIQRQFIADASHELKTPISTLKANLDILYASQEDTIKEQAKWLDNSKKVLSRMTTLIQCMLELAKVDELDDKYKMEDVLINHLLDEAVDCCTPLAAKKNIVIMGNFDVDVPTFSNYDLIQQVVDILMDNAVKYTNEIGTIQVSSYTEKNESVIRIQNTGDGISPADIDKIFNRFYRGDRARVYKEGNYGLGLSIAKSVVQKLRGKISVESNSEHTVFTVRIPNNKKHHHS